MFGIRITFHDPETARKLDALQTALTNMETHLMAIMSTAGSSPTPEIEVTRDMLDVALEVLDRHRYGSGSYDLREPVLVEMYLAMNRLTHRRFAP